MFCQPSLYLCILVCSVVIPDQMQLEVTGRFLVDFLEERQPLLMAVLAFDATDQLALKIIRRREQRDRGVANVIMGFCSDVTDPQRQSGLNTLQGLNLTFFVAAEHPCLVWRSQIQPDDIPEFLLELRVVRHLEGTYQMRLQVIGSP